VLPLCLGELRTYSLKLITGGVSFRVVKFEKDKSGKGLIAHYVLLITCLVSTIEDRPFLKALKYCLQHAQQASKISAKEEGKRRKIIEDGEVFFRKTSLKIFFYSKKARTST
jgi:hypothetical protein